MRPSPLQGHYYIESRFGYWALTLRDAFLRGKLCFSRKNSISFKSPPSRILLANVAHLGDVLLLTSLFAPLKQAFPHVQIGVVVGSWALPILQGHPMVDKIHLVDHWKTNRSSSSFWKKWLHFRSTMKNALQEIKGIGYEVAIDVRFHFPNVLPLFYQAKIPMRIGYISGGNAPLLTHPFLWEPSRRHVVEDFLALLSPLGVGELSKKSEPSLPFPTEGIFEQVSFRLTSGRLKKKQFLLFHIGAGDFRKQWPLGKWITLALSMRQKGYEIGFTAQGEGEKKVLHQLIEKFPQAVLLEDLVWEEFVAVVAAAAHVVCPDTVVGHLAAAMETPTIVLTAGINPLMQWRPMSAHCTPLTFPVPCAPCYQSAGCPAMVCVRDVSVEWVTKTLIATQTCH